MTDPNVDYANMLMQMILDDTKHFEKFGAEAQCKIMTQMVDLVEADKFGEITVFDAVTVVFSATIATHNIMEQIIENSNVGSKDDFRGFLHNVLTRITVSGQSAGIKYVHDLVADGQERTDA